MAKPNIIAIDGPAASGKSTLAEKLAGHLGYMFFDTGIMYRAVTWAALNKLDDVHCEKNVTDLAETISIDIRPPSVDDGRNVDVMVDQKDITWDIRTPMVDENVSVVAAYPGVRRAMTEQQRKISMRGQIVVVGRDIGTVVCPEADLKIYLDASVEERARRRYIEVKDKKEEISFDEILSSMKRRDQIDSTRTIAPLKIPENAVIINSDGLNFEQVMEKVLSIINNNGCD